MRKFSPAETEQLIGLSQQNLRDLRRDEILTLGENRGNRTVYSYADILAIETARQLNVQGVSWKRALEVVAMSGGIDTFVDDGGEHDFWIAELYMEHEAGAGGEASAYVAGPMRSVMDAARSFQQGDRYRPNPPSRIFMTNISAADRRIRARAGRSSIEID